MPSRQSVECGYLTVAVAITRYVFRSHYLYDLDSVNFALGMKRFNPAVHQPHPPGYFLYICLGRLLDTVFHNPNAALVCLSIAASCGAVLTIYKLAYVWFGSEAAVFAGILFLFSPLAWFHGTVALTYIVEAFLSALVGYLCWAVYTGHRGTVFAAAATLGFTVGVRPSSALFLGPLFLLSLRGVPRRYAFLGIGALGITILAWVIPMIRASGGTPAYLSALFSLWWRVPAQQSVMNSRILASLARLCVIAKIYILTFGCAIIFSARALHRSSIAQPLKLFTQVWIFPGLLFFTFVFLKFANSGYLLVLFPPVCAWLGLWLSEWYREIHFRKPLKLAIIGASALANVFIFVLAPVYCSYRGVQQFEIQLTEILRELPQVASPVHSLVIGFDVHLLGFRHAGYYLPSYWTAEYSDEMLAPGNRIFVMRQRDTQLLKNLSDCALTDFVFFPLPSDEAEYGGLLSHLRAKFPHTVRAGGREFITGRLSDLRILFPRAVPHLSLCTARH